ncbi:MAG: threonine/serine exporter family protein [Lactobacillaceae bacterium]|jgi:uncharacterized membrane protein YjjB (DUF3815 family)|nr:threonine/serine exporter family protein [Lactobacillaceae bacterium]
MKLLIEFGISFMATIGFGIITNIPRRALPVAGVTGAVAWSGYMLLTWHGGSPFIANFTAALIIGLLGNVFAVYRQVPVNMIYIPSLVSLVPGGTIYLAMKALAYGQHSLALQGMLDTLIVAIALAAGFVVAETIIRVYKQLLENKLAKH